MRQVKININGAKYRSIPPREPDNPPSKKPKFELWMAIIALLTALISLVEKALTAFGGKGLF